MVMDTVMDITDVAGGDPRFIIQPAGVAGTEVQDLMDSMEITSMYIIMYTSTTQTMCIGAGAAYPVRVITEQVILLTG